MWSFRSYNWISGLYGLLLKVLGYGRKEQCWTENKGQGGRRRGEGGSGGGEIGKGIIHLYWIVEVIYGRLVMDRGF